MQDFIIIRGAKEHNLKNISLSIPKNKFVVITGLSGSGKSSLAFDTIFAEGQRRYVESLSSYARQFLEQLQKPDVEHIEGLSPAIAIEQRTAGGSPRSIVATQTEIYDYLRLLFARVGRPHCHKCGTPIQRQTSQEIIERVMALPRDSKINILSPMVSGKKGLYQAMFERLKKEGFARVRVDGKTFELDEDIKLQKYQAHNIEIIVDRIKVAPEYGKRIAESIETALKYSDGRVVIVLEEKNTETLFSSRFSCPKCGLSLGEIEPRLFSFNSPFGACPACNGLGTKLEFDCDLIVPDKNRTLAQGAIDCWRRGSRGAMMYYRALMSELASVMSFSLDTPYKELPPNVKNTLLYGTGEVYVWDKPFEGVIPNRERFFKKTDSIWVKQEISAYMSKLPCPQCKGSRLKKESLAVTLRKKSIWDVISLSITDCQAFFAALTLTKYEAAIAHHLIKEIKQRLDFCLDVGLGYLSLNRLGSTLSGGEAQRIRLATQVGSALSGVLYILDEPTIGLHSRDDQRLIRTLKNLRDLGNTVIVVEHDEQFIRQSDWLIDLGPGAGRHGGEVVFNGKTDAIYKADTATARYLNGKDSIPLPQTRRPYKTGRKVILKGCREHNLKNIDVEIPLGTFICVTGVSGSGKSTLVEDIFYRALARRIYDSHVKPGAFRAIEGLAQIDKVIIVDQAPIGRTPRSNPATYTGVYAHIRDIFAKLPEAKIRGYRPARFSFNVSGGRCEACQGDGIKKIEMHFLPDVYVPCEVCAGKRFNAQTLEITFKGQSISDVLAMTVEQALGLFEHYPRVINVLKTLHDVGLDYITLGQFATTLSGGEAQRIKLAAQLRKKATGRTIYILDEPTTGLHFADTKKLLSALDRLVDKGNTVLIIEHNLDVIKCADYIIDLGPEGGDEGGRLLACGTPEEIARCSRSYTGRFLKDKL